MAAPVRKRPFNNFRLPISDPDYFFGRDDLLSAIQQFPFQVRILLGGRRIGKTSTLNALRWTLLSTEESYPNRAFPVLINLQKAQPSSLDHFRYLLIARLREAIERTQNDQNPRQGFQQNRDRLMRQVSGGSVSLFGISLNVTNPATERRLIDEDFCQDFLGIVKALQKQHWLGVCFLLDGAEYIVCQKWASNAWGYLRGLKETTNVAIEPFFGLVLSGYGNLKKYQQETGSPLLGIADTRWVKSLADSEVEALVTSRCLQENIKPDDTLLQLTKVWGGGHPYLVQQFLNAAFDNQRLEQPLPSKAWVRQLIRHQHEADFSKWWDENKAEYGFGQIEQTVYLALVKRQQAVLETLAEDTQFSIGETEDALEVLA